MQDFTGMTDKQITASFRAERLSWWLRRQPIDSSHNRKQEAVECFKTALAAWADDSNPHTVAPTFHFWPHAC